MLDEEFEQEVQYFRQTLRDAVAQLHPGFSIGAHFPELKTRLKALAQDDYAHFRVLCGKLLVNEQLDITSGFLRLLHSYLVRDNFLSMLLIRIAIKRKELRREALVSLRRIATRVILPQLFIFAEKGYADALDTIRYLIRTPEEIERGTVIARKYIGAKEYFLRQAALFLLQRYSSMEREAEEILKVVQKYTDELFIDALDEAQPAIVLEPLKALRERFPEKSVEYHDLTNTINALEMKQKQATNNRNQS